MTTTLIQDPAKAKEFFESKMAFTTGPVELERMMKGGSVNVVDVRAAEDYEKGHIPGAVNLPKEQWAGFQGLRKDRVNVLYCYSLVCHLAATAAVEFAGHGFPCIKTRQTQPIDRASARDERAASAVADQRVIVNGRIDSQCETRSDQV